ncbi:MAG: FAD:protein FMN transferase [Oceanospirillaceae bacterium]|nr:FAD:protein FMN transferase [Oceanospirillaceae bacterium]MCP5350581.1 FAD:protein FMN transferase [Oceanospirillaceae bacterium]
MLRSILLSLILFLTVACSESPIPVERIQGYTMGTTYHIQWRKHEGADAAVMQPKVDALLAHVNQQMSTYIPDSELSLFNKTPAPAKIPASSELRFVLSQSLEINHMSGGYFDVTVGPLVNLWGFGPDEMNEKKPSDEQIRIAKAEVGSDALSIGDDWVAKSAQRYVDLSAIAKGFGVDQVAALLEQQGIKDYLVEIGGELRIKGQKQPGMNWKVAVEAPDVSERRVQKVLSVADIGMATSGDYRNYFEVNGERFSHTIDPFTGSPVRHKLASVTILHPQCSMADGLATTMMVMGEEKAPAFATAHNIAAYFIVSTDNGFKEIMTPAFAALISHEEKQ